MDNSTVTMSHNPTFTSSSIVIMLIFYLLYEWFFLQFLTLPPTFVFCVLFSSYSCSTYTLVYALHLSFTFLNIIATLTIHSESCSDLTYRAHLPCDLPFLVKLWHFPAKTYFGYLTWYSVHTLQSQLQVAQLVKYNAHQYSAPWTISWTHRIINYYFGIQ